MKSIFTIIGIVLCSMLYSQTSYTFHTAGNWTDAANWSPSYPGESLSNLIANINAACNIADIELNGNVTININSTVTSNGGLYEVSPPNNIININSSGTYLQAYIAGFNIGSNMIVNNNGTLSNNGLIEYHGNLNNNGIIQGNSSTHIIGDVSNYGSIFSNLFCDGGTSINNGTISNNQLALNNCEFTNYNVISTDEIFLWDGNPIFNNLGTISNNPNVNNYYIHQGNTYSFPATLNFNIGSNLSPGNSAGNIVFDMISPYNDCISIPIYNCEINGITPITQHDQITVTNCANLSNATLNVTWGFTPSVGQTFDIITYGSRTGQFTTVNIPPIAGLSFSVDYTNPLKTSIVVSSALPITYSKTLEATQKHNSTILTWSVATQINNDKYIIEHSIEGGNFSPIGEIEGDGTSNITKHYEYIHTSPSLGINYYRIKQLDFDGKYSFSDIARVRYDGNGETSIYPNPATSEVTVEVSEHLEVLVTDIMGRVLHKQTVNKENNVVDLSGMPSGLLIFSLQNGHKVKVLKD